jgi:GAF domain-containing protein
MFRVLILDDDPRFGQTLARNLERNQVLPCEVVCVTSDVQAYDAVRQSGAPFDAFLIDQRLGPEADGISVLQDLLRISPRSEAVVFTVVGDMDAGLRAYQAGAFRYIHKPFSPEELILILQSLSIWRATRHERDWLRVLVRITAAAQSLLSVEEMGQVIVENGQRLGFERARLWLFLLDDEILIGANQVGNAGLENFQGCQLAAHDSPYTSRAMASKGPSIFHGQEYGPSHVYRRYKSAGFLPAQGDWITLPLWAGARCVGMLLLDNHSQARQITDEQREVLTLFGQQAAAALERAQLHEQEQLKSRELERRSTELEVLSKIGRRTIMQAALVDLDELLSDVRRLIGQLLDVSNFFIALSDQQAEQIDLRLDVENDIVIPRHTVPLNAGLVGYVIARAQPLLLSTSDEIRLFSVQHKIRQKSKGPTTYCWLGVPLQIPNQVIGALVVRSTERERAYTDEDLRLLIAVAGHVAGAIQTARLKETTDQHVRRLAVLQQASEALMRLAERSDEWLWHAALTVTTAGYGLGFNRAMLFLLEAGGTVLRGRMGIGNIDGRRARAAWKHDDRRDFSFEGYLRHLTNAKLPQTAVDKLVRHVVLDLPQHGGAFNEVLRDQKRLLVPAKETEALLPAQFTQAFGTTTYAVLPLCVGNKRMGVLVVDNVHTHEPLRLMPLNPLETLWSEVALVYENLRQRRASDQLIDVNHIVLAQVAKLTLKEMLNQICAAAQAITGADCVLIYPFEPATDVIEPCYDIKNTGYVGLQQAFQPREKPSATGVTMHVLQLGTPLVVNDVATMTWSDGQPLGSRTFLIREGIGAFVAVPISDMTTNAISGVLFLNYRTPQPFDAQDARRALSFASLAGAALRASREEELVRKGRDMAEAARLAYERELEVLRGVLEQALKAGIDREQMAQTLLRVARELLGVSGAEVGLILREWNKPQTPTQEPEEVRLQYSVRSDGTVTVRAGPQLYTGITGRALNSGQDQNVQDVTKEPWKDLFVNRASDTAPNALPPTRSELDVLITLEGKQILGLFNIESPKIKAFTENHHSMVRRLAAVAALALDGIRRQENLRNVLRATEAVIVAGDVKHTLDALLEAARRVAPGVSAVTIWYKDPETQNIILGPRFGVRHALRLYQDMPKDNVLDRVMRTTEPTWATAARDLPLLSGRFLYNEDIVSTAALSLRAGDAHEDAIGALFFNYRATHEFTREERVLFPILATIAAACVRDAMRLEAMHKQRARLDAAIKITEAVGTELKLDDTLRRILGTLNELFPKAQPCVLIYNPRQRILEFKTESFEFYRIEYPDRVSLLDIDGDRSIACRVARTALAQLASADSANDQTVLENIGDVRADEHYLEAIHNTRSELCLALMSADRKRLLGVLVLESEQEQAFNDDDVALVRGIGPSISIALERAYQSAELSFQRSVATATAWVAEIAHDINREVGNIRYQTYELKSTLSDAQQPFVDQINESADKLAAYAMTPRSTKVEAFDLDAWLRAKVMEIAAPSGVGIECVFQFACQNMKVDASKVLLERVLRHLVRNALEHMQGSGCLTVGTRRIEDKAEVRLTNTGPEIPDWVRQKLLIENVSTKGVMRGGFEGGLGLLFVRWAVEEMCGAIALESRPGEKTTTFSFTLPLTGAREGKE